MPGLRYAVTPLRIMLALLFLGLLGGQALVVPEGVALLADEERGLASLEGAFVAGCVLGLCCIQVVIVCIWKLLDLVTDDRIFSEGALVWVDVIVWAIAVVWLLLLGFFAATLQYVDRFAGVPAALLLLLLSGGVLGLLMVVMRTLLRQATTLRVEMESVI